MLTVGSESLMRRSKENEHNNNIIIDKLKAILPIVRLIFLVRDVKAGEGE